MIVVLAGGVGAARFLTGLLQVVDPTEVMVVANVGDDCELHGLHISPDIDTVVYTLAGAIDPERGWGLADESWRAMENLGRYANVGALTWFNLGDRDMATHLWRTQRLRDGATLSAITAELAHSWGLSLQIVPVTNDRLRTWVTTADGDLSFQEYFVRHRHGIEVSAVRFEGATSARPTQGLVEALLGAQTVVVAPSNPIVSIGPLLAVPGIREALISRRRDNLPTVAISPLIGGAALKGPADRMLRELGHRGDSVGVAAHYRDIISALIIDVVDVGLADEVRALGIDVEVTDTIMSRPGVGPTLARLALGHGV